MKKVKSASRKYLPSLLLMSLFLISPSVMSRFVHADEHKEPLLPACGVDCGFTELMQLINNSIDFLITRFAVPITALAFAYAGFLYLSSSVSPAKKDEAKKIFGKVLTGFIFALAAWIIIKGILVALGYKGILQDTFNFASGS